MIQIMTKHWWEKGFPGDSVSKESTSNSGDQLQCRRPEFDPSVGKILWRTEWQLTPVFSPGKFHGQRSLAGYSPWGHRGAWRATVHGVTEEPGRLQSMGLQRVGHNWKSMHVSVMDKCLRPEKKWRHYLFHVLFLALINYINFSVWNKISC